MRRLLTMLVMAAGVLASAASSLAAADAGSIGIRLLDVPAQEREDPRARVYIVDHLPPGSVIRRRVLVSNTTRAAVEVTVYPAAASIRSGVFSFTDGRSRNELTTWTSTDRRTLRLEPGTAAFATVRIAVPPDASAGERYAVVWAETSSPAPAAGGVTLVNRVGVRVYLSIGRGGAAPSSFTVGAMRATRSPAGQAVVVADVHNTGGRALDIAGDLTLSRGPGGLRAGPFRVELGTTLAPGESAPVTVRLDRQLPDGPWRARLALKSGLIKQAVVATIRFPHHAGTAEPAAPRSRDWTLAIILAGLILAALALSLMMLRRRRPRHAAPAPPARVATGRLPVPPQRR